MTDGKEHEDRSTGVNPDSSDKPDTDRSKGEGHTNNPSMDKNKEVPYMELFYSQETAAATSVGEARELTVETSESAMEQESADNSAAPGGDEQPRLAEGASGMPEDDAAEADPAGDMDEDELNRMIEEICKSKAQEFRMLGYEQVTGQEVWECVSDKYKKHGVPPLHRIVNDILSLKVTSFMNWMMMSIYKDSRFR